MTAYYEEIMELWKAGKFFDAISYFAQWIPKGLASHEEIENLNKNLLKVWELVEAECEENPEVLFSLYQALKKARNWDDETLRKELRISEAQKREKKEILQRNHRLVTYSGMISGG